MANLPSTWQGYIQQEETKFKAADSEYTAQRTGSNLNYLKDQSDAANLNIGSILGTISTLVKYTNITTNAGSGVIYNSPNGKQIFAFGVSASFTSSTFFNIGGFASDNPTILFTGCQGTPISFPGGFSNTAFISIGGPSNSQLIVSVNFGGAPSLTAMTGFVIYEP